MWCESKDPRVQQACNILASKEQKNFVCVAVVCLIAVNGLTYLKDPFMKCMSYFQKKIRGLRRNKKTPARVPQPCVLKADSRVDIERWVKQARLFVQDFDEGRRAEVVMMSVDEQQRDRLESHCFVERPMSDDERVEYLFGVIISMYKKKEGSPTDNKDKFLRRKQKVDESITEFAAELKDVLYQAWPKMPREQLEDLLIDYFIGGLQSPETSARVKVEKPKSITKAIDVAEIYENMLNNNTSMLTQGEYTTPSTYSIFESPSVSPPSINPGQHKILEFAPSADCFTTPTNIKGPNKARTITLSCINMPNKGETTRVLYLNNTEVEYIPDTGAAISVISKETAKRAKLNVLQHDKNKVRVMTADDKEVQDVTGYVEADVTLGEHQLKGVRM